MKKSYKYYVSLNESELVTSIPSSVDEFKNRMRYDKCSYSSREELLKSIKSRKWVMELHENFLSIIDKNKLTVGFASGEGEHELLLHLAGYRVIATDIIPELTAKFSSSFPGFKSADFNVLDGQIADIVKDEKKFDLLVTGFLSYFDENTGEEVFRKIYDFLPEKGNFIFVLRCRESIITRFLGVIRHCEAFLKSKITGKRLIKEFHGYMRSEKEIMNLAENAGFRFEKKRPSMLGYECGKVGILAFLKIPEICSVTDKIFPLFHSAVIFKFSKPIVK